jgi:hypothetical protein
MNPHRYLMHKLGMFGLLSMLATSAMAEEWRQYLNERYGFRLEYPADLFVTERATEAGDGQVFASADNEARLLVGALANSDGYTPTTYQQYIARQSYPSYQIDYRRIGGTWFALSGEGKGQIFYEKVMFTCDGRLINSFAMIYPSARRHIYDAVVERIEKSFRPSTDCQRAGLSPLPPRPQPMTKTVRPSIPRGERSELADRIARARGHDVIVILRRTTPPYDRKILRGYASRR